MIEPFLARYLFWLKPIILAFMLKKLALLTLGTYILITLGALAFPFQMTSKIKSVHRAPEGASAGPGYSGLGFAMVLHYIRDDQLHHFLTAIDQIAAKGFTHLLISTPMTQVDAHASGISLQPAENYTPKRTHLVAILNHAKAKKLTVTLMPIVWLQSHGKGWRGKIQPKDWAVWWRHYHAGIVYFAKIAQETRVDILSIGSELLSTESQLERWTQTIALAREHFQGRLTYSANWDNYAQPSFWDQLDMIGINAYFDMASTYGDSRGQLKKRWDDIQIQLKAFTEKHHKPLLITELGYPALPTGLTAPYDYTNAKQAETDRATQYKGYQAFIDAWSPALSAPAGSQNLVAIHLYLWQPASSTGNDKPKDHPGYLHYMDIQGTKSLQLIEQFIQNRHPIHSPHSFPAHSKILLPSQPASDSSF